MSGLAMWIGRDGRPADYDQARRLAAAASHRARRETREVHAESAVAIHLDGGQEPGLASTSPQLSSDNSLLIVADARVDNRSDIARALTAPDIAARRDDTALLLEAYRRWGESFADRLAGDFAIAIWDLPRRRLVAARDTFALRPLHYRVEPDRLLVASEVGQILAVDAVEPKLFEPQIVASLARVPGLAGWTYYEGVERVPPGHTVVIDAGGVRVRAHATLGCDESVAEGAEDWTERVRTELSAAVLARLEVTPRPGMLLSGGLDSTSVAGIAGRLRQSGQFTADLLSYGFAYDELRECDELSVSTVITSHYGFTSRPVPADSAWPLAEHPAHGPVRDGPDRLRSHVLMARALALARADDVTCLMSGYRGDALLGGQVVDYIGCLAQKGPAAFWHDVDAHSRRTGVARRRLVARHVLRRLPALVWPRGSVASVRGVARGLVSWENSAFPRWLRGDAIERFGLRDLPARAVPRSRLPGEARRRRHDYILKPEDGRSAEGVERLFASAGIRYADPWADRRLAELMLHIPQYVITPAGEPKRLLRDAMRGVLPEPARTRAAKRSPQPLYVRGLADRARGVVLSLIDGSRAAARGYVDEGVLRRAYERFVARPELVGELEWRALWRFVDVEDWLRRFHG